MKALQPPGAKLEQANWKEIYDLLEADDDSWIKTLHFRWPTGEGGPGGYTALLLTANKTMEDDPCAWAKSDLLKDLYMQGILRGGVINDKSSSGNTLIHMAISQANMLCLECLHSAQCLVETEHPSVPVSYYPNWMLTNDQGKTPLGHWIASREKDARSEKQLQMKTFLRDRILDMGYSEIAVREHEEQQRKLGIHLNMVNKAAKVQKRASAQRDVRASARSPSRQGKRQRIDAEYGRFKPPPRPARVPTPPPVPTHPAADDRDLGRRVTVTRPAEPPPWAKGQGKWGKGKGQGQGQGKWGKGNWGKSQW